MQSVNDYLKGNPEASYNFGPSGLLMERGHRTRKMNREVDAYSSQNEADRWLERENNDAQQELNREVTRSFNAACKRLEEQESGRQIAVHQYSGQGLLQRTKLYNLKAAHRTQDYPYNASGRLTSTTAKDGTGPCGIHHQLPLQWAWIAGRGRIGLLRRAPVLKHFQIEARQGC